MKKHLISALLALLVLLCLPLSAAAAHAVPEAGKKGSITVLMVYAEKPLSGGELTLYRVGDVAQDNGDYFFVPTDSLRDWNGSFEDLENADQIARDLAKYVSDKKLIGTRKTIGKNGEAKFDNGGKGLEQGLYLVVQTVPADGFQPISPFLVSLPYFDGTAYVYDVTARSKTELERIVKPTEPPETPPPGKLPQTGQLWWPVPILISAGLLCITAGLLRRRGNRNET